jgi:DNA-binding NarL/FixJ family response regulator
LAGLPEQAVSAVADALTAAEIFARDPELRFVHPLVRAALYDDIAPARRAVSHRQAAAMLAQRGARDSAIAAQLLPAERTGDRWAVAQLISAASAARRRGAPEAAREMAARALAEPPPTDLRSATLEELGFAELDVGDPAGVGHLHEALAVAPAGAPRGHMALRLGQALHGVGEFAGAIRVLATSLDQLSADVEPQLHRALESELIVQALQSPASLDLMQQRLETALAAHAGSLLELDTPLVSLLGLLAIQNGRVEEGLQLARQALSRRAAVAQGIPITVAYGATALRLADQLEEALATWNSEVEDARRQSAPLRLAWASDNRAMVLLRLGRVVAAEADARTAVELQEALFPRPMATPLGTHAETLLETAAPAEAHALMARAALDEPDHDVAISGEPLRVRARLRAEAGDLVGALSDLERIARLAGRYATGNPAAMPWRAQTALVRGGAGELHEALRLVDDEIDQARSVPSAHILGGALRARGLLRRERGLDDLDEAVSVLAASQDRLEHIRALIDHGAALRRASRRAAARLPLREALDLAARGGATALASRARVELAASGARPRRDELRGRNALTASERRIATLAAEGRTNREIAQALFVTQRTVETHLTHVYAKLDVQGRDELAGVLP